MAASNLQLNVEELISCNPNGPYLGKGPLSTVFIGQFGKREVAVKRIKLFWSDIIPEIKFWLDSDAHQGIVQYFATGIATIALDNYMFVALELCECSLKEWVEKINHSDCIPPAAISKLEVIKQLTKGVVYLHQLEIVHRDLKPENVLLRVVKPNEVVVKICDFGISSRLPPVLRRSLTKCMVTSECYMPPEILLEDEKIYSFQTDIFSLGCVYYYALSNGQHPFGKSELRRLKNIMRGTYMINPGDLEFMLVGSINLIKVMTSQDPKIRPPPYALLNHHIFFEAHDILKFFTAVSNCCEQKPGEKRPEEITGCIEQANSLFRREYNISDGDRKEEGGGWRNLVGEVVLEYIVNQEKRKNKIQYKGNSLISLLRIFRNLHAHPNSLPEGLRKGLGMDKKNVSVAMAEYLVARFPYVLDTVWYSFQPLKSKHVYGLDVFYGAYDFVYV